MSSRSLNLIAQDFDKLIREFRHRVATSPDAELFGFMATVAGPTKTARSATAAPLALNPAPMVPKSLKAPAPKGKPGPKKGWKTKGIPSLKEGLKAIIRERGNTTPVQALAALQARGWMPESKDPLGYIRYTLSTDKEVFLRTPGQRGVYHLGQKGQVSGVQARGRNVNAILDLFKAEPSLRVDTRGILDKLEKRGTSPRGKNQMRTIRKVLHAHKDLFNQKTEKNRLVFSLVDDLG